MIHILNSKSGGKTLLEHNNIMADRGINTRRVVMNERR